MRIGGQLRIAALLGSLLLAGCVLPRPAGEHLQQAEAAGFHRELVTADGFVLTTLQRVRDPKAPVRVYIEGDGRAWMDRYTVSDDPTPHRPLALQLAMADLSPNVAWLARPCQFSRAQSSACRQAYWTDRRFSPEVIAAMHIALDHLAARSTGPLELVGYSGGAAIAVVLAAQRKDVSLLVTVAGNLDSEAVNRVHRVDPMPASLNPIAFAPQLAALPQRHLVGSRDSVIPADVATAFVTAGGMRCAKMVSVDGAGHEAGWVAYWQKHWPEEASSSRQAACEQ